MTGWYIVIGLLMGNPIASCIWLPTDTHSEYYQEDIIMPMFHVPASDLIICLPVLQLHAAT